MILGLEGANRPATQSFEKFNMVNAVADMVNAVAVDLGEFTLSKDSCTQSSMLKPRCGWRIRPKQSLFTST